VRKGRCAFFILVLAGCLTAGCSYFPFFSPQNKEVPNINIGFTSTNFSPLHNTYSFDEVTGRLAFVAPDTGNSTQTNTTEENHILYIRGTDMDETGAAESWMFAVRHGNQTSLVTFDSRGKTISDGSAGFKGQEIFLDQIVTPGMLFDRNRAAILKTQPENSSGSTELELWGGNYTLTIAGQNKTRVLIFDAKTGALILSND